MDTGDLRRSMICSRRSWYAVVQLIGMGRFSRVYEAKDAIDGEQVVVKVLRNKIVDGLHDHRLYAKELSVLNELKNSPLRVRFVELKDVTLLESGRICFVMERLGTTLHAVLHNIGRLPMSMCRSIVRQIAQGLTGLKMLGIVHADLKPDNIMFCAGVGNNHRVKIIDFGWSFYIRDVDAMCDTKLQAVPYRAPEVCFQGRLGHGLDVWALGCIAPEIVTGVKLFDVTEERLLVGMMVRTLDVPEFWASDVREEFDDNSETMLSRGWFYFQGLAKNNISNMQNHEDVAWFTDLVYKMLTVMPDDRIRAVDALNHPFLTMVHFIKHPKTVLTKRNVEMMGKCLLDI